MHVDKYPLRGLEAEARPVAVPVVIGVNWYAEFDVPVKDRSGAYWIARDARLTRVRGGHCVALEPAPATGIRDNRAWWGFYDQGSEGACVGFGISRAMSLLNRRRYDARWLYQAAQKVDGWPGESYSGTSVRAGMDVLRTVGHRVVRDGAVPAVGEGIAANRWATSISDVLAALGDPNKDFVTILNSWGKGGYPHRVRMPASVLDRLLRENGEIAIVTDR